ncbi:MAG: hypothetical protein M0042_15045 [Nitrospiraceae bacterium]|nr:hypothetical protein [Nitrospiraceae bacterium]
MASIPVKLLHSPCQSFEARLAPETGSAWDISHASLALNGLSFGNRRFGWHGAWSSCSRYFMINEWLNVHTARCPDMQLLVIDVHEGKESIVEKVSSGFIEPMGFRDEEIKYCKIASGIGNRSVHHLPVSALTEWRVVR